MTKGQRISLMSDWWPKACEAQGWNPEDRELRLKVLGEAVKRPLNSASDLNHTDDIDAVKRHLGFLADNVAATIETDHPLMGRARRLREAIREYVKCLALYHPNADAYLAKVIRDKFRHGEKVEPLTIDDLSADPMIRTGRDGKAYEGDSQLDQVVKALARGVQSKRKAAGDTLHEMKTKAGISCSCRICLTGNAQSQVSDLAGEAEAVAVDVEEGDPF